MSLVEAELASLRDDRVVTLIRQLLVTPTAILRGWDYGSPGQAYPCWAVLDHPGSNTGIVYCEFGFGPRMPWGLVFLRGAHLSIGMDSGWFGTFLEAFFESAASSELPIWRVFRREGHAFPGVPITAESSWHSTWEEVYRLRSEDPAHDYNCWHSIQRADAK